jgi:hypothetical protein
MSYWNVCVLFSFIGVAVFHIKHQKEKHKQRRQNVIIANNVMSKNMNRGEENIGHHMEQCHE